MGQDVCCRLSHDARSGHAQLHIERSVISDAGLYAVGVATAGHVTSALRVGVVSQRPVFAVGLHDLSIIRDQPVTFAATVHGVPRPHIRWLIGGVEIAGSASTDTLRTAHWEDGRVECTLLSATEQDVGVTVECRAWSEAGEAVSRASIIPGRSLVNEVASARSARTWRVVG